MPIEMSPEDRERILTRSTEMLKLAREVVQELRQEGEEPTYGEEPSIPEIAAIAQLITNMGAVGLFKSHERPPAPPTILPTEPVKVTVEHLTPELGKALMEKVSEEAQQILKDKIESLFPDLLENLSQNVAGNIYQMVDAKLNEAIQAIDAKIAEAFHHRGFP